LATTHIEVAGRVQGVGFRWFVRQQARRLGIDGWAVNTRTGTVEIVAKGEPAALKQLDDRSRRIVEERWLKVNDDGSGGLTLHDLAAEYGVSAERIRQIESAAMKKMKKALAAYA